MGNDNPDDILKTGDVLVDGAGNDWRVSRIDSDSNILLRNAIEDTIHAKDWLYRKSK